MDLSKASKIALQESRLLILGAQVLLGFQFQVLFRETFSALPFLSRQTCCASMVLMALSVGLLIAPSMQHQIVERGFDSRRLLSVARRYAAASLVPFALALAGDVYVTSETIRLSHPLLVSGGFLCLATLFWFVTPRAIQILLANQQPDIDMKPTSIEARLEQMLTEARVILPGVQALLGFQLVAVFTSTFERMSDGLKIAHFGALSAVLVATMLLMTVPVIHRVSFHGADDERFLAIGTSLLLAAPAFLAVAATTEIYVGLIVAGAPAAAALSVSGLLGLALAGLWYGWPLWLRWRHDAGR